MSEHHCTECHERIETMHEKIVEIAEFLEPLKAMAAGLGPMQKMGMSPGARAAAARIRELSV